VARESPIEIDDDALRHWPLPLLDGGSDKEERGRVVLLAASREIPGAAVLAATAALRAGAGKVTIGAPSSVAREIALAVIEARVIALEDTPEGGIAADGLGALDEFVGKTRAVLVGPGLPYDEATCDVARAMVERFSGAGIVFDAAAMRAACLPHGGARRFTDPVLLTPHAGEMASLTGASKEDVLADPASAAIAAARDWNAVVVLKGATTHIAAPDGRVWRHQANNPGLATSGSGDVLAGIIAGLIARGAPLEQAAAWGVALHARAGANLAQRVGPLGFLARELPAEVPSLMEALARP
jgi:hydroxyethylthiazole kinase-like uncharacterized protein yjeF